MRAAIFVVDDEDLVARATAGLLRRAGHHVLVETSGKAAFDILKSDVEFDVTFLDLLMPDMTGGEIYTRCMQEAPARLRRLCFLTAGAHLVPTWIKSTGLPVIDKPANSDDLFRAVELFAKLDCSRGPQPMTRKKDDADSTGRHLPAILDADNDEESDEDVDDPEEITSVAIKKIQADQIHDHDDDTESFVTIVRYVRRKHNRVVKRVDAVEDAIKDLRAEMRKYIFAASVVVSLVLTALEVWRTLRGH